MKFQHAVVTGGGGGLGRGFALELASRGVDVTVSDVDLALAEETAELARAMGVAARAAKLDVRDATAFEEVARVADAARPVDLLVNNAGVMVGGALQELSLEDWRFALEINLFGAIHGTHAFAPRFVTRGRGHFLNVASIAGVLSTPETGPYNVSKAGIISLTETTFAELGKWNVGATVLCPSAVRTGIIQSMRTSNPMHRTLAQKNAASSGPREPRDVARIALDSAEAGKLYVFPQVDAKLAWFAKRMMPDWFARLSRRARNGEWLEKSTR